MIRTVKFCKILLGNDLINNVKFCRTSAQTVFPINDLASDLKIVPQRLQAAFDKNESLYKSSVNQWKRCFQELKNQGFRTENSLNMVTTVPQLLHRNEKFINDAVEAWRDCQFGEGATIHLLSLHPQFLSLPKAHILHRTSELMTFAEKKKQVVRLLEVNPNVMFTKWRTTAEIISYLKNVMKITDISEICKSSVFQVSLGTLKCRHTFLKKLGLYKIRDPKASEQEPNPNPKLIQIVNSDDAIFATKIAGVTLEEFRVYQQMCLQEKDEEDFSDEDEDDYSDEDDNKEENYTKSSF